MFSRCIISAVWVPCMLCLCAVGRSDDRQTPPEISALLSDSSGLEEARRVTSELGVPGAMSVIQRALVSDARFSRPDARYRLYLAAMETRGPDGVVRLADDDQIALLCDALGREDTAIQLEIVQRSVFVDPSKSGVMRDCIVPMLKSGDHRVVSKSLQALADLGGVDRKIVEEALQIAVDAQAAVPAADALAHDSGDARFTHPSAAAEKRAQTALVFSAALLVIRETDDLKSAVAALDTTSGAMRTAVASAMLQALDGESSFDRSDANSQIAMFDFVATELEQPAGAARMKCCLAPLGGVMQRALVAETTRQLLKERLTVVAERTQDQQVKESIRQLLSKHQAP